MSITKSNLLQLANCPNWFWLSVNEPELLTESLGGNASVNEGNAFETFARGRFPGGVFVAEFGEAALAKTKELVAADTRYLFQATAMADGVLVKADVLEQTNDGEFNLYEVKASSRVKDDHLLDIAIQRAVFNDAGFNIGKCFLVILDSDYV